MKIPLDNNPRNGAMGVGYISLLTWALMQAMLAASRTIANFIFSFSEFYYILSRCGFVETNC